MTVWQQRLRVATGLFVIVFAAGVYLAMRRPPPPVKHAPVATGGDPRAKSEINKGTYTQYKQGKLVFTLNYDRVLEYAGGTNKVQGVHAIVKTRDGKDVDITGNEAAVGASQSSFVVTGNVQVKTPDGLVFTTNEASYAQGEDIVRAPGPVTFTRGRTTGESVGLTYDKQRGILTLLANARLSTQESEGERPATAEGATAVWARGDRTVRFDGNARIIRGGQTLEADSAMLYLSADEQRAQRLELRGNSRITPSPEASVAAPGARAAGRGGQPAATGRPAPGGGTLRTMHARDINLMYGEDGRTLQQALLSGGGVVEVQSAGAQGVTRIAGESVDLGVGADGASLRSLLARAANAGGYAELQLPPQSDAPARVVRSALIQGPSPAAPRKPGATGINSLRFSDNVEYHELPAPAKPGQPAPAGRVAYARMLDLTMDSGFGTVDDARFSGNVRFKEGESLQATSGEARYVMKTGQLDLSGVGPGGEMPKVIDDRATVQATAIKLTPDGHKIIAERGVQAEFRRQENPDATTGRTPHILSGDQPVLATSDRLDYDGANGHAVFTSKAKSRLWQPKGGTTVHGVEITLDDATGNLWAKGGVVSTMVLEQLDSKTKQRQKVTSEAWADQMFYEDGTRRATYTSNARIRGQEGDLKSDKAVLFLSEDGSQLERLEATGRVVTQTPNPEGGGMRTATGERLVYTASNEQYVMTGKVSTLRDDCNETQGRTLTFFRSAGTIVVDGNQQRRTEMRSVQGCKKESRPD
jgi:LPS export ABC transporter protein LptC/lipopolysaccharide transport protein LptA